jgi:hypothetical protein
MSNCVDIKNPVVRIPNHLIDTAGLRGLIASAEDAPYIHEDPPEVKDAKGDRRMAYWFLDGNVLFTRDEVIIEFGAGRSTHTFRDFEGTIQTLRKFIRGPFSYTFQVSDMENNTPWSPWKIDFWEKDLIGK